MEGDSPRAESSGQDVSTRETWTQDDAEEKWCWLMTVRMLQELEQDRPDGENPSVVGTPSKETDR